MARTDHVQNILQFWIIPVMLTRIITAAPEHRDLISSQTEDENIIPADRFHDFDISAVQGSDRQSSVKRHLHVSRPRSFHSGGRDLLRKICGRDDLFRLRDTVIGQKHYPEESLNVRIPIYDMGHRV